MTRTLLAIESATDWLSVALLQGDCVVELQRSDSIRQHSTALLPMIDATLTAAGLDLDGIDALAVSTGPGSFTSVRIGLATAKGLAFRREIEAVGVSTLEAMAMAGLETGLDAEAAGSEVLALLDARRGEWYAGSWTRDGVLASLPKPELAEGLYSPDRLAAALSGPLRVLAPEAGGWLEAFEAGGVELTSRVLGEAARPSAEWVGRLGQLRLAAGEGATARELAARYLRRAEAEAKRLGGPVEAGELADLREPGERA